MGIIVIREVQIPHLGFLFRGFAEEKNSLVQWHPNLPAHSGQEQRPTQDKEAAELWDAKNRFALGRIIMGVSDRDVVKIARLSTAAEAWKTLEENYKMGERATKIDIYRRLRNLRLAEGSRVRDYIDNFEEIITEATNLNMYFTSDEEDLGLRLLSGLPPSFDNFVERFIYQCQEGREALTLQSVKRSLVTLSTLANV
jgi:hypothetical protein